MAKFEHLPIYKKAMELTVFIENAVKGFSRFHKYSIGTRMRETSWSVLSLVIKANNTPVKDRLTLLRDLRDTIADLNTTLTVAKELKTFANFNSYRHAARLVVDIGRQSEGWLKSAAAASSPESYSDPKGNRS